MNKCYCMTCRKSFSTLGISRHRAMHRDKKEYVKICFSDGSIVSWDFSEKISPLFKKLQLKIKNDLGIECENFKIRRLTKQEIDYGCFRWNCNEKNRCWMIGSMEKITDCLKANKLTYNEEDHEIFTSKRC